MRDISTFRATLNSLLDTSANLRYTVREGIFQMLLVGDVDFESLKSGSIEAIQSTFNKLSGRSDLKITEILYHGEWR